MRDDIRLAIKMIYRPGDTIEIRTFAKDGTRRVGRYPLGWDIVRALEKEDSFGRDCYYVLNPTGLAALPIGANQSGTKEGDVPRRKHFLLDFDPVRKHKIASEEQYLRAWETANLAYEGLTEEGWSNIVMATSGNGVHLLVPIDLPNDEPSKQLIRKTQRGIAERFYHSGVEIECFPDAARLVRAYGTTNHKGEETETLKYRQSGILLPRSHELNACLASAT